MSPEPPSDASELAALPAVRLQHGWRVFRAQHNPLFYFRGPSRFVPISPSGRGVLYLADSPSTALAETFGGRGVIVPEELESRALARVAIDHLRLADATGHDAARYGLTPEVTRSPDEGPSQRWAAALVAAGFDGVVYPARNSPSGKVIAVFGAAGSIDPPENLVEALPIQPEDLEAVGTRVRSADGKDDRDMTEHQ